MRGTEGRITSSRIGVRDMLSYQSFIPAGAGTPRDENEAPRGSHLGATLAVLIHPSGFRPSPE